MIAVRSIHESAIVELHNSAPAAGGVRALGPAAATP